MTFIWSIFAWLLIGAVLGWIASILWRHPQGCVMDGAVAIAAMVAGALIYGAVVGTPQLIALTPMSLLAGVLLGIIALAIVRAWRTDVEAETLPRGEAAGWEPEDAPPAPKQPLSEREPEEVGEGTRPEEETPEKPITEGVPDEPLVEHEPKETQRGPRPDDGSPGPEEIPDQQEE